MPALVPVVLSLKDTLPSASTLPDTPPFADLALRPSLNLRTYDICADLAHHVENALLKGPGLVIVRGASTGLSDNQLEAFHTCVGSHLGRLMPQNRLGHLKVEVRDVGAPADASSRGFLNSEAMRLHTDGWDAAGLVCLASASHGGASLFMSSLDVHNHMVATCPDELAMLKRPLRWDIGVISATPDAPPLLSPIFSEHGGRISCRYSHSMVRNGWSVVGEDLPDDVERALDAFDRTCGCKNALCRIRMERGDAVWMNNRTVLHGREAFKDGLSERRHLVRLWVAMDRAPTVQPDFERFDADCFSPHWIAYT